MADSKKREAEAGAGSIIKKFKSCLTAAEAKVKITENLSLALDEKEDAYQTDDDQKAQTAWFKVEFWYSVIYINRFLEAHRTGEFAVIIGVEDAEKTQSRLVYNFLVKSTDQYSVLILDALSDLMGDEAISKLLDEVKLFENGNPSHWETRGTDNFYLDMGDKSYTKCNNSNYIDIQYEGRPSRLAGKKTWMAYTNKNKR